MSLKGSRSDSLYVGAKQPNVLTVDVEDWYQTNDFNIHKSRWHSFESRIEKNTDEILQIFDNYNVKATFFVLSYVAEKNPELIRRIVDQGHEIGSHGCYHQMVSYMTPDEFKLDVRHSRMILEDTIGKEVFYYRSPSWSITRNNLWALEILEEEGFTCDSSFQPIKTPLSGDWKVPLEPFRPVIKNKRLNLVEFPSTVLRYMGLKIPFAGGLFLRIMPDELILWALKRVNEKRPGLVYIHPWEIDIDQPELYKPIYTRLTHYANLRTTKAKLNSLLSEFKFVCMGEFLDKRKLPEILLYK